MKTIKDFSELSVTIKQLKRQARRERAKERKQKEVERMNAYKLQMSLVIPGHESREHLKMFRDGMPVRSAKKFHNNVSSQQAGTLKPYTTVVRSGYTAITIKKR